MKIKLEMDRERALQLSRACETIARCGMRQFEDLIELIWPMCTWDDRHEIAVYLRSKIPPLNGIADAGIVEPCRVAWDAYQHLRREVSWADKGMDWRIDARDWDAMSGVCYDVLMRTSKLPGDFKTEVEK